MGLKLLSDIYPPSEKPVREGWYLTGVADCVCDFGLGIPAWWDGMNWLVYPGAIQRLDQALYWRGLAIDVNAAKPIRRGDNYLADWPGVFVSGAEVER